MPFAEQTGYTPMTIEQILFSIMPDINTQFSTNYTESTFPGSNHYKFAYAIAQRMQQNEVKASEIFLKLQQYFSTINAQIARARTTPNGMLELLGGAGYISSEKKMIDADAGKRSIAVDLDNTDPDYADIKETVAGLIFSGTVGGVVLQGTEVVPITISNGQLFDSKFFLPDRHVTKLKLTITISENNQIYVQDIDWVRQRLFSNIKARYRLGLNFEPQKYFTQTDAPWASEILLEYSLDDGATWLSSVYDANFDDLLTIALEDIEIIEE